MKQSFFWRACAGHLHLAAGMALLLAVVLPVSANAAETPEAYVARSVDAVQEEGMGAIAQFMHPDELVRFKAMIVPLFAVQEDPGAEAFAHNLFGPQATAESIAAMPAVDFMRVFLDRMFAQATGGAALRVGDPQILGSVREGDVVHVVLRSSAGVKEVTVTKVQVTSVKSDGDGWGLMLTGDMEGLAEGLRTALTKQRTQPRLTPATPGK